MAVARIIYVEELDQVPGTSPLPYPMSAALSVSPGIRTGLSSTQPLLWARHGHFPASHTGWHALLSGWVPLKEWRSTGLRIEILQNNTKNTKNTVNSSTSFSPRGAYCGDPSPIGLWATFHQSEDLGTRCPEAVHKPMASVGSRP